MTWAARNQLQSRWGSPTSTSIGSVATDSSTQGDTGFANHALADLGARLRSHHSGPPPTRESHLDPQVGLERHPGHPRRRRLRVATAIRQMKGMKGPQTEPGPGTSPQAARAALATVTGQGARIGIQIVGLVVLARLLSPYDYGLFAMVTAVIGVAEVFRDFGLSSAAVQAKTVSAQQRSNLFWVNTGIGLLLTGLAVACAPLVARLFGQPELTGLTMLVAVTFLMNGVATQFRADLNRHMRIGVLVVADVIGQAAGLVAGVVAATMGAGYCALAVMAIVGSGVGTAMLIVPCGWIPGRPRRGTPMKAFFTFGGGFVPLRLLSYSARSADSVVLGATLGPTPLGLYSRAYQY